MCTVVFIPGEEKYYFASLRDESPDRQLAIIPSITQGEKSNYLAPIDPLGGGTWLGVNENGYVIILLNGGFENHTKKNNYAKSRGKIVTELLAASMPVEDWNTMDLNKIEPFTLIVWCKENLFQLVWDGMQKYHINLSKTASHIWSSATLYTAEAKNKRTALFKKWISSTEDISTQSLFNFFLLHKDSFNGFIINRNEKIKTLNYTFITVQKENNVKMNYYDFLSGAAHSSAIALIKKEQNCLTHF